MYELFEHTADLGLRVVAPDLATLFRDAAEGLFSMIVEEVPDVPGQQERRLSVEGARLDHLLFDWLNELLYVFESKRLLLRQFELSLHDGGLEARALGQPLDFERHRLLHEVKAITYHRLKVERTGEGWLAEVIVDI